MSAATSLPHRRRSPPPFPGSRLSPSSSVDPRSAMSSAVADFPSWVLLEPFVLRRDNDRSFPDESDAPIRASGTTSWGADFLVAFSLAKPPHTSHLYAKLPGFPGPSKERPLAMIGAHRHLALLRVGTKRPGLVQDFFIYSADKPSSLERLPPCTVPSLRDMDLDRGLPPCRSQPQLPVSDPREAKRRLQTVKSMGLLCLGEGEEFEVVVAELKLYKERCNSEVFADIYLLKKSVGQWESLRLCVTHNNDSNDVWQLSDWQTNSVIPVGNRLLCWIDYYQGILMYDVCAATTSFLRFPLGSFPCTPNRRRGCSWLYRGVSAIDAGCALKFVNVARDDGIDYGALKPGAGFTISCHTISVGSTKWKEDCTVTSDELWTDDRLPREVLMFPQVDMDMPHVVHFFVSDFTYAMKKMWVVSIDMNTKTIKSFSQYLSGREDIGTERERLTENRSMCPTPFFPCEFSKYLVSQGR